MKKRNPYTPLKTMTAAAFSHFSTFPGWLFNEKIGLLTESTLFFVHLLTNYAD